MANDHLKKLIDNYGRACVAFGTPAWESKAGEELAAALTSPVAPEQVVAADAGAPVNELVFVQPVPSHCDRITWRGSYYHLPISASPEAAPAAMEGNWQQYAKDGETAQDVIEREREDSAFLLSQLIKERAAATPAAPSAGVMEALRETVNQLRTIQMDHRDRWSNERTNRVSATLLQADRALAQPAPVQAGAQQAECERCGMSPSEHTPSHRCDNQSFTMAARHPQYVALMKLSQFAHTAAHMSEQHMRNNLTDIADQLIALAAAPTQAGAGDAKGCEAASNLSNLLARIHRDGGHYEDAHGTAKAYHDADCKVMEWITRDGQQDTLQSSVDLLKAAKDVAFSNGFDAAYPRKLEALRAALKGASPSEGEKV